MTSDTFSSGFNHEGGTHNASSAHTATGSNSYLGASGNYNASGGYGASGSYGASGNPASSGGSGTSASTGVSGPVPAQGEAATQGSGQNTEQFTGQDALHSQIEQHLRQQETTRRTQWQNQVNQWREEVAQDPQLGGVHMAANVARAQLALDRFDQGRHIGRLLEESGYGNNPEVLRFFNRVADALMEDSLVRGEPGSSMPPLEERMYAGWSSRK